MIKNIFTILLLFCSYLLSAQAVQLPVNLLGVHISINYASDQNYCLSLLGSGPIEYVNPFSRKWKITTVNNTEGKTYYAFKYKETDSYLCAYDNSEVNTRSFAEGTSLDRKAVFEVYKSGDYYLLYNVGTKSYLRFGERKRGGKVYCEKDVKKASKWNFVVVPRDPNDFLKTFKPVENSIAKYSFMICNEKEDKCIQIDNANQTVKWVSIPKKTATVLWEFIPIPGFDNMYIIRNSSTKQYLRLNYDGAFRFSKDIGYEYVTFWRIRVVENKVILTPIPSIGNDKADPIKIDDSIKLTLIRRDS